jgi:putrescine transport system substrate-binding protein
MFCRPRSRAERGRWKPFATTILCLAASSIISCGNHDAATRNTPPAPKSDNDKVLNFFNWSDYIGADTIPSFEKLTGIKVNASYFDSTETAESRILTGSSGFDVVVTGGPYFQREIRSGAYLALDKAQLPNLVNLDPHLMLQVEANDPGNAHGVVYTWGTHGIGYNEKMLALALPHVPVDSWCLIFDPAFASKLAACGINIIDKPAGVVRLVLKYLGKDPSAPKPEDLIEVESVLMKIRPYVRTIDSEPYIQALANGDICIALGTNGDIVQARRRTQEAKSGNQIDYVIPKEGSLLWFDELAIPKDAPHVVNAYRFINYLLDPQVIGNISNFIGYANANVPATRLLDPSIASDPMIYPPPEVQQRLFVQTDDPPEQSRVITRIWQKFKTGQ